MLRASLIVWLVSAGTVAHAAPAEYTLPPLPTDWKDVTAEALKQPAMIDQREQVLTAGGTFEAVAYMGETGGLLVARSVFAGAHSTMSELNAFVGGVRRSEAKNALERGWHEVRTPAMVVSEQRLDRSGQPATTKVFTGFTDDDELRTIAFFCFGEDAVCDGVLSKVTVDSTGMQLLAELDTNKKKLTPTRIAWIVGALGTFVLILAGLWKRRPRAPK